MKIFSSKRSYYILIVIAIAGLALLYAVSPMQADDFWYLMTAATAWSPLEAMQRVWQESVRHWSFDTGRLANLICAPFLTVVPKWAFAMLCAAALVIIVHYSRWLADASARSMRSFLLVAGIVFALPWFDFMFSVVFALNYLWTSSLVLMALWYVFKADHHWHFSAARTVGGMLICLLAGWMHEGFSVPLLCGIVACFIVERRLPARRSQLFIGAFAVGALLIAVSPALHARVADGVYGFGRFDGTKAVAVASLFNCLYLVFVAVAAATLFRRPDRRAVARIVSLLTATTVSTAMLYLFYTGPRMAWFGQLFSGIGILYCCSLYRFRLRHGWKALWTTLIIIGVAAHLGYAIVWQQRLTREFDAVRELYTVSADGRVFFDVTRTRVDASLLKPSFRQFNESSPIQQFSYYYGPHKPDLRLLPADLQRVDTTRVRPTSDPRLVVYGRHVLVTDTLVDRRMRLEFLSPEGEWVASRSRMEKFTDSEGRAYTLVVPDRIFVDGRFSAADARFSE